MIADMLQRIFPEPKPCTNCGETNIQSWFVGGGYEGWLPFWVRMKCPRCGRQTEKKLFRSRAVRAWNQGSSIGKLRRSIAKNNL